MFETAPPPAAPPFGNLCIPFQLDAKRYRGRLVRLGSVITDILARHHYPSAVQKLLAESLLLGVALAGALKYEGVFTLQASGDGAIRTLVVDVTSAGAVRGYVGFDEQRVLTEDPTTDATALLLGKGYVAFTVDQGQHMERYQGIVELSGRTMADCVAHYFKQSEQLATGFVVSAAPQPNGQWHGGLIMLQRMPRDGGVAIANEPFTEEMLAADEEDLRRNMILLGTTTATELLAADLAGGDLLYRLFHEEGISTYPSYELRDECRCSRARVERVLRSLPAEEIEELKLKNQADSAAQGGLYVDCEFCSRRYVFNAAELHNLDKIYHLDDHRIE